jgi:glutathione S-transferase
MLTLYGNLDSGNVYKVRLALALLGFPHRRVDVAQVRGEPRSPAFLAINPIGKVPAIVLDDGRVLSESGAILFYLAQGTRLWPGDPWDQAAVLRWMFFEQYSHEPFIAVNRYILRYAGEAERARLMPRVPDNHVRGNYALDAVEQHLTGADWLAAGRCTIADIALYAYTYNSEEGGFNLAARPATRRWLDRIRAEPGHIGQMQETSAESVQAFVTP